MSTEIWLPTNIYYEAIEWCYKNDQLIGGIFQLGAEDHHSQIDIKNGRSGLYCENDEDAMMIAMHWLGNDNEV